MVNINNFLYLLHTSFGDPGLAGWITSGILCTCVCRRLCDTRRSQHWSIQAMCALQLIMAAIFLIMAFTVVQRPSQTSSPLLSNPASSSVPALRPSFVRGNNGSGIQNQVAKWDIGGGVGPLSISILIAVILSFFILWSRIRLDTEKNTNGLLG